MRKLAPGIYLKSFNRHGECLSIVKDNLNSLFTDGTIVRFNDEKNEYYPEVNTNSRKVAICGLSLAQYCHPDDEIFKLKKILDEDIGNLLSRYRTIFNLEVMRSTHDWIVMKYDEGCFFKNHRDDSAMFDRRVSVIVYLNDDYSGGEIEFPDFGVLHKPKAGDVLFFPSAYSYVHNIKEITKGTRYAVVNWYTFINDKK